ncbi:uncharacterized protein LOC124901498 [Homo sapiens]|uniref:uncharacterized protein LOC124901498 n=1 Tax=Homo sapiens TaxID=9606 RepID=UPI0005D00198|nr:uncharacterized protein LOC124901498 [Homo sapiens]XP_047300753.1 uncharacterized protein LOC124901498 [Homo sapiens]|eukprot:XP_011534594.1 uncharacterized protein LOC105378105 [Homo sapiens]
MEPRRRSLRGQGHHPSAPPSKWGQPEAKLRTCPSLPAGLAWDPPVEELGAQGDPRRQPDSLKRTGSLWDNLSHSTASPKRWGHPLLRGRSPQKPEAGGIPWWERHAGLRGDLLKSPGEALSQSWGQDSLEPAPAPCTVRAQRATEFGWLENRVVRPLPASFSPRSRPREAFTHSHPQSSQPTPGRAGRWISTLPSNTPWGTEANTWAGAPCCDATIQGPIFVRS